MNYVCAHLAPVFRGRCERCGQQVAPPPRMVDEAATGMVDRLRSFRQQSPAALLDEAAELIELLHAEIVRMRPDA